MLTDNFAYYGLMKYFEEISAIPRATYHEEGIADYLCDFARKRGLEYYRDAANNVLINKPATADCENKEPLLLQGHIDMVCEKNEGVTHDFDVDGLELYEAEGWIRANGTTLGADDGVAVAVMLYVLDGGVERHSALQCLFTASEEVGLDGAKAFDYSRIYARRMINMDSADEALVIAGCAGGQRSALTFDVQPETVEAPEAVKISLKGLFGGHSGEDIDKGRANANKLMGKLLYSLLDGNTRLVSIHGGARDNAIPRECEAVLVGGGMESIVNKVAELEKKLSCGLCAEDGGFSLTCEKISVGGSVRVPDEDTARKFVLAMQVLYSGVLEMNREIEGLVEWSRNLGIVNLNAENASLVFLSRSSFEKRIDMSAEELDAYARVTGGRTEHYNRYPGWSYAPHSAVRDAYARAFERVTGKKPEVTVIHAGLECGFISGALPDMDIISCGPVVQNLHSPDERLNKKSFERFFTVIKSVIEE